MADDEKRTASRHHLLLLAELQVEGEANFHQVKVRDLSESGMRAQGDLILARGTSVKVRFKQLGTISGEIAWSEDMMFGVRFDLPIDPMMARPQVSGSYAPAVARIIAKRIL